MTIEICPYACLHTPKPSTSGGLFCCAEFLEKDSYCPAEEERINAGRHGIGRRFRLRRETVAALTALWRAHPDKIVGLSHRGIRGNPCLFPHRFFRELLQLEGDTGGGKVIRAHTEDLLTMEAPEEELLDVDDRETLARLAKEQGEAQH